MKHRFPSPSISYHGCSDLKWIYLHHFCTELQSRRQEAADAMETTRWRRSICFCLLRVCRRARVCARVKIRGGDSTQTAPQNMLMQLQSFVTLLKNLKSDWRRARMGGASPWTMNVKTKLPAELHFITANDGIVEYIYIDIYIQCG